MAELVILIIVIVIISLCLGVNIQFLASGVMLLIMAFVGMMLVLFAWCAAKILRSQKVTAVFVRIEKNPKSRISNAVYKAEGVEYPCMFPAEVALRDKLYNPEKPCTVLLDKKKSCVFDRSSVITCVVGLLFSVSALTATLIFIFSNA